MTTAELTLLADLAVARLSGLATALLAILPAVLAIARLADAAFVVFRAIPLAFVLVRLRVVAGFVAPVALTLSEAADIFLPAGRAAGFMRALVTLVRLAPAAAATFREEPGVLLVVLLVRDVAVRDVAVRDVPVLVAAVLVAAVLDVAVLGFAGVDEAPRVDTRLAVPAAEMLFALAGADFAAGLPVDFAAGLVADFAAGFAADFAADLPVAFVAFVVAFVVAFAALVVFVVALVDGLLLAGPRFTEAERAVAERAVAERAVVRVAVPVDFADRRDSSSSTRS
ncbi:hypothetical protein [Acrocarpospora macrocephala]|uniref:hypothetical protein n=1 Tax=Acrocarpospora macrocephala TaxID=150177 RepID=UPI0012D2AD7D|nr:hypothetical protein [Acrocarpospora macrocephala]